MVAVSRHLDMRNRILASLPHAEFIRVQHHLETVRLEKGETVYLTGDDIQYAYFLNSGLLSLLSTTGTGSTLQVAMVGNEGMVGLPLISRNPLTPHEVTVQFTTDAFKIRADALQEEFEKGEALHEAVLRYVHLLIAEISQFLICKSFHPLVETLSSWLLTVQDRVNSDSLNLTHENISSALGVPRTAVTVAAGVLQRDGLIRYSRGKIIILDRDRLKTRSCECYRMIHDELTRFLND